jgi:hypothetical protein
MRPGLQGRWVGYSVNDWRAHHPPPLPPRGVCVCVGGGGDATYGHLCARGGLVKDFFTFNNPLVTCDMSFKAGGYSHWCARVHASPYRMCVHVSTGHGRRGATMDVVSPYGTCARVVDCCVGLQARSRVATPAPSAPGRPPPPLTHIIFRV